MELHELCMGCMGEKGEERVCPRCGWEEGTQPQSPLHLPPRTVLNEKYLIGRVLGQGGFGITYLAWDINLNLKLAIKEYLPQDLASRAMGQTRVAAYTGSPGQEFEYGLDKFLQEARTLAQFEGHPNVVSVRDFFRANGTAYIVMSYVEGITLKDYVAQQGERLPFDKALAIIMPVLDALSEVHEVNILHRDISPDNIFINHKGQVILIDFGAARHAVGEKGHSRSIIMKPGFTPEEQYRSKGVQGPWTDIYAVAATLYRIISGRMPPESLDRLAEDTLVPPSKLGVEISPVQEQVLLKAMAVRAEQRFQKVKDFQDALLGKISISQAGAEPPPKAVWHVSRDGARFGPYTWAQMVKMAGAGNVGPLDYVWSNGMSGWKRAGELQGLFPAASPSSRKPQQSSPGVRTAPPPGIHTAPSPGGAAPRKKSRAGLVVGILTALLVVGGLAVLLNSVLGGGGGRSTAGNTAANIACGGIAAVEGGWIYYTSNDDGSLYKMKLDGSETAKVSDDSPWYINVIDGWIYYTSWDDDDRIFKIRTDGSGRTALNEDPSSFVSVTDKWIYYINEADEFSVYRMRTDGSEQTRIGDAETWYLNVDGEWLYFVIDDDYGNIYRMRADGTALTRLNEDQSSDVIVEDGWIYYANESDGSTIYRMRTDGSDREKLNDHSSWSINYADGWLYYINSDDRNYLYKMRPDGSTKSPLNSDSSFLVNIAGDLVFYFNQDDEYNLYIVKTNGSGRYREGDGDGAAVWSYEVEHLQFYESPFQEDYPDLWEDWEPDYRETFFAADLYYIYFDLLLSHPPVEEELTVPAAFIYYQSDGSELTRYDFSCTFYPGETSTRLNGYYGWDQPGNWPPGRYRVELQLDGVFSADNYFEIK